MPLTFICPYRLLRHPWHDDHTRYDYHKSHNKHTSHEDCTCHDEYPSHDDSISHDGHTRHDNHTRHEYYTTHEEIKRTRPIECLEKTDQDFSAVVTLDKLPVDIVQCIADFLPLDSVACLILTRKKVTSAMGHRTWLALRAKESQQKRLNFLYTMQRDLIEWIVCFQCEKLHPLKRKPLLCTERNSMGQDTCSEADGIVELLPNYILRWQHAHMIMRLHDQNPTDHKWLSALSHVMFRGGVPYALCCARITKGHLLVKTEYRILLPEKENYYDDQSEFPQICAHWDCLGNGQMIKKMLNKMLFCSFIHDPGSPGSGCTAFVQCQLCATESLISVAASDWSCNGRAAYITAWRNFGPCQTPFDMHWRTHTSLKYDSSLPPKHLVRFKPGSIRKAFEKLEKSGRDGVMSMSPLDSDVEYNKRLDECSRGDYFLAGPTDMTTFLT